ncbi:MAG: ribbon-helix-helix protein, CopG family [Spirochaetales bacterium]|nr:ribbon-helix-helix protein, CopG family [Spirochaetales bacterium]
MAHFTERLQLLLSPEEMDLLRELSRRRRTSVNELVRSAIARTYSPGHDGRALFALEEIGEFRERHRLSTEEIRQFCLNR